MRPNELLLEAFARIPGTVRRAVDGLERDALTWRIEPGSNPIGWLVWHLTRVQDDHVAELADATQIWAAPGWAPRFGLPNGTMETGYGHTPSQVDQVRPEGPGVLLTYLDEVTTRTNGFLETVDAEDLDQIVDTAWDPPVTMGVRLVSVVNDGMQHAGQAAFVRGVHDRLHGVPG